ncbi:putative porin [Croceivirga radicis]|uniref:putative porin n=1 Tax=Croceivirga radicis TaxID=1929488 RepID=UPI000255AEAC|nr:putative porin [Croceivirga radicis]
MKYNLIVFIAFLLISNFNWSQTKLPEKKEPLDKKGDLNLNRSKKDSVNGKKKEKEVQDVTIANYKIINFERDTIFLDTTLNINKEYKFNYLRKDDFELMPFANLGHAYNRLSRSENPYHFFPRIGASARNIAYFEVEDINYYNVATPLTELFFKTTMERGQLLDALLTLNTSKRFNASVAYTGLRSLGKYDYEQTQAGRFRATFNYRTLNNRYWVRGHFAAQDLEGEESGGLADKVLQFESGDENLLDRGRIDLRYTNADNKIVGKRYFLDHQFNLVRPKRDSIKSRSTLLAIGHQFNYETKYYQFLQSARVDELGEALFVSPIDDKSTLRTTYNQLTANFSNKNLGNLNAGISLYNYDYAFGSLVIKDEGVIPSQLKGEEIGVVASYKNKLGGLEVDGKLRYTVSGELTGNMLDTQVGYQINNNHRIYGKLFLRSKLPDFNYLLYQSDYTNYNWYNKDSFENEQVKTLTGGFASKWFGNLNIDYSLLDNYTYFGLAPDITQEAIDAGYQDSFVRPFQDSGTINYLKVKYQKEIKYKKWALNNTFMYQEVNQDAEVLNVPQLVTRNTLYFSSDVFDKAMFLQTGVTFKYFSTYKMDGYNPLLAEFYTQTLEDNGAYPLIDLFINAKVRQTRIFLKAEHLNTIWTKEYNYYAAPNYPYRDFVIRFGLVWNFFS